MTGFRSAVHEPTMEIQEMGMDNNRSLFITLLKQSRALLAWGGITGVLSGLFGASIATMLGNAMHGGVPLASTGIAFAFTAAAYLICKSTSETSLLCLSQQVILHLRVNLSNRILGTPFAVLRDIGKSRLLAILTSDINTFVTAFQVLPQAFGNVVVIMVCFGYMAWISLPLFMIFVTILIVCTWGYHLAEREPLQRLRLLRKQVDRLYVGFRGLLEGTRELQLNRDKARRYIAEDIESAALDVQRAYIGAMRSYVWVSNAGSLIFYLVIGGLVFAAPHWARTNVAPLGTLALILMFLIRPIGEIISALPLLRQANVSWSRIQLLSAELGVSNASAAGGDFNCHLPARLRLDEVTYDYRRDGCDEPFRMGPINLDIDAGETVFIVGGNGSGKSSLALILLGLIEPAAGRIHIDDVPVTPENRDHYRQYFSAVLSDFHLFERLFDAEDSEKLESANALLLKMGLAHKTSIVDGRLSTVDLSTGQRKRLALISAHLESRPIHVYDEWAAEQDPSFRKVFYMEILPELKKQRVSVIVITHDDEYFACADKIVHMRDGRIVAEPGETIANLEAVVGVSP